MVYAGQIAPDATLNNAVQNFWNYMEVSLANGPKSFNVANTLLTGLSNVTEYQNLFEQYRLTGYKVTLMPRLQDINAGQTVGGTMTATTAFRPPRWVLQKDATTKIIPTGTYGPTVLNQLLEGGGKILRADRTQSIYIRPKVVEQYGGGADRYVSPKWTDLSTAAGIGVPHRGFNLMLFREGFDTSNTDLKWDVFLTYFVQFRNPR